LLGRYQVKLGAVAGAAGLALGGLSVYMLRWGVTHPQPAHRTERAGALIGGAGTAALASFLLLIAPVNLAIGDSRIRWARRLRHSGLTLEAGPADATLGASVRWAPGAAGSRATRR
jgi:hypothetical protein